MKTEETATNAFRRKRFGEVLYDWIDFLNITVEDLAKKTKIRANYITAVKRGTAKGGIDKPTKRNAERLIQGLEFFYKKPITMESFWDGPPSRNFRPAPAPQHPSGEDLIALLLSDQSVTAGKHGLMTTEEKRLIAERLLLEVELLRRRSQ